MVNRKDVSETIESTISADDYAKMIERNKAKRMIQQQTYEIDRLHELLEAKDTVTRAIRHIIDIELEKHIEHYHKIDAEIEHLRKENASLRNRVSKLQASRDFFKNEYNRLCIMTNKNKLRQK